jgi:hypothetical protein
VVTYVGISAGIRALFVASAIEIVLILAWPSRPDLPAPAA